MILILQNMNQSGIFFMKTEDMYNYFWLHIIPQILTYKCLHKSLHNFLKELN